MAEAQLNGHAFDGASERRIDDGAVVGVVDGEGPAYPPIIGLRSRIRRGAVIYCDVVIGDDFSCGHNVLVREGSRIGNGVMIGTNSVLEGNLTLGDFVRIQSNCYVPTHATIGDHVFMGPGVVLTNDKYVVREWTGPIIEAHVTIGGGATILPGVRIGCGSFIGAGAVVTRDVPPHSLAVGVPARAEPLPAHLRERSAAPSVRDCRTAAV